ncbi:hypothetical protein PRIPAC_71576 [Pristionchus pacificus]|uniref:TGF_BETA_2 domain-containing protein n=1 Tax=Pristionchus pacificus TaxID=54126 RepID=A0A2A6C891_PRIPA|nr:hypothetical protein PRIPAC_71576 [Pristionchus pacificus]|eukprot:PDM74404.1 hypothetical protein PRIPAC_41760 [Pristionchus pacificus]
MNVRIVFGLVLVAVHLGFLDGCSHRHEDHHMRKFRHKLLRGMGMREEQIKRIEDDHISTIQKHFLSIDEAKQLLPMLNVHEPTEEKRQTRYVIEKDAEDLLSDEHLFELPDEAVSQRDLLNAFVNFHARPVLNSDAKVTIDVKAREAGSETFYYVGSQEINAYPEVKKLRMKLDTELMKRWFTASTSSIILTFELRDSESNLIINKDDYDADGKRIMLELALATRSRSKRRTKGIEKECKEGVQGQECCIRSKIVKFKEMGMKNVLSPEMAEISWCEGACKLESSFEKLFSTYTTMMHHDNSTGEACCHGTSSSHIDILYTNEDGEVNSQRVYDVAFTECRCA